MTKTEMNQELIAACEEQIGKNNARFDAARAALKDLPPDAGITDYEQKAGAVKGCAEVGCSLYDLKGELQKSLLEGEMGKDPAAILDAAVKKANTRSKELQGEPARMLSAHTKELRKYLDLAQTAGLKQGFTRELLKKKAREKSQQKSEPTKAKQRGMEL